MSKKVPELHDPKHHIVYTKVLYLDRARTNELIKLAGDFLYVKTLTGTLKVRFDDQHGSLITLAKGDIHECKFSKLYLTNTAQSSLKCILYIGVKDAYKYFRTNIESFEIDGVLKVVAEEELTTNGDVAVDFRPSVGKRWKVLMAWGYHDDVVNRNCNWQFYDGTTTIPMRAKSVGTTKRFSIVLTDINDHVNLNGMSGHLILTRDVYAQFKGVGLAAGKKVYAEGLVLELDD